MIGHLRGTLASKFPGELIIDVGGIGYQVIVSLSTFYGLPAVGAEVSLDIHTHVREDSLQLYGFCDRHEKQVFELLLSVSGIGPRLATNILSGIPAGEMVDALTQRNLPRLMAIPGVGRRLAERLTVELKERAAVLGTGRDHQSNGADGPQTSEVLGEATSALVNLGYRRTDAERVVSDAARRAGGRLEDIIRVALQSIAG